MKKRPIRAMPIRMSAKKFEQLRIWRTRRCNGKFDQVALKKLLTDARTSYNLGLVYVKEREDERALPVAMRRSLQKRLTRLEKKIGACIRLASTPDLRNKLDRVRGGGWIEAKLQEIKETVAIGRRGRRGR